MTIDQSWGPKLGYHWTKTNVKAMEPFQTHGPTYHFLSYIISPLYSLYLIQSPVTWLHYKMFRGFLCYFSIFFLWFSMVVRMIFWWFSRVFLTSHQPFLNTSTTTGSGSAAPRCSPSPVASAPPIGGGASPCERLVGIEARPTGWINKHSVVKTVSLWLLMVINNG